MNIPTSFQLLGQTITVRVQPDLSYDADATGQARYRSNEIVLQKSTPGWQMPRGKLEQVYLHEVVHHILYQMGHKLFDDEKFVDLFASMLHQVLITQKGTLKC